jgi:hypothetical protein
MISTISKRSFKLHFFNDSEPMKTRIESNRIESESSRNRIDTGSVSKWQKPNRIESLRDVKKMFKILIRRERTSFANVKMFVLHYSYCFMKISNLRNSFDECYYRDS